MQESLFGHHQSIFGCIYTISVQKCCIKIQRVTILMSRYTYWKIFFHSHFLVSRFIQMKYTMAIRAMTVNDQRVQPFMTSPSSPLVSLTPAVGREYIQKVVSFCHEIMLRFFFYTCKRDCVLKVSYPLSFFLSQQLVYMLPPGT